MHDPRELRKEALQDRLRRELRDAPAAGRLKLVADTQRALVEGLHELQIRPHQKGTDGAVDELWMCARHVGVDPRDDVAAKDVQTFPERLALPAVAAGLGQDLIVDEDRNALLFGDLARAVLRARVDDDELVDQRNPLNEAGRGRAGGRADRGLFGVWREPPRRAGGSPPLP